MVYSTFDYIMLISICRRNTKQNINNLPQNSVPLAEGGGVSDTIKAVMED